jgi:hypothetical protein
MIPLTGGRPVTGFLEETIRDFRYALRALIRHHSFTVAAVLSLALGIGSSVAIFTVVDAALLNPLPYDEPEQLIAVHGTSPTSMRNSVSYPNYLDWREHIQTVDDIAASHLEMFTLTGRQQAERLIGGRVSAGYFNILRVQPLLGRTFDEYEDRIGGPPVVNVERHPLQPAGHRRRPPQHASVTRRSSNDAVYDPGVCGRPGDTRHAA